VFVGSFVVAQAACISNDNAAPPGNDAGSLGDTSPELSDAPTDTAPAVDTSIPEPSPEASVPEASTGDDAGDAIDAADAADAALPAVTLVSTSTNVTTESSITLTATLNGVTATSIEIDDGATAIATLTASPYTQSRRAHVPRRRHPLVHRQGDAREQPGRGERTRVGRRERAGERLLHRRGER
jgi:hypothetical protein